MGYNFTACSQRHRKIGNQHTHRSFKRLPYKITIGENTYVKSLFDRVFLCASSALAQDKLTVSAGIINLISFYLENCSYSQKKVQDQFAEVKKIEVIIKKRKTEYRKYLEEKYQKELDEIKSIRRF